MKKSNSDAYDSPSRRPASCGEPKIENCLFGTQCAYFIEDFRGCAKLIGLGRNDYFNGGELNCKMNGLECNELNSNEKKGRFNEGPVYDV
jgi:hypothetical protein